MVRCLLLAALLPLAAGFQVASSPLAMRRASSSAAPAALMQFGQKQKEKEVTSSPSFFDKFTGKVVKTDSKPAAEEDKEDSKAMMQKVKDAGVAGIIS